MKAKMKDILMFKSVSAKLLQNSWKDPKKSYNVFKVVDSLDSEQAFYEKERFKLAVELGEEVESGKYTIKPENEQEYKNKINEILDLIVEIPEIEFTVDDILDTQCNSESENWYTPIDMYKIEKFLNDTKKINSVEFESQNQQNQ